MKKIGYLALAASLSIASAGCYEFTHKTTAPSNSLANLAGNWSSGNIIPNASSCTDFKWTVTEYTGTNAKGSFNATCAGNITFYGTAEAWLTGSIINWKADATGSAPGLPNCPIALTGTATLTNDTISVPYSGQTCLGAVSGTEVLKRK
ncbi:MAG: hypothetical protein ACM36C_11985 [Acidobacteriota bacterium]